MPLMLEADWRRQLLLHAVGTYLRWAPEHPGRWRLVAPAVALAPQLKHVTGAREIRVREGFRMRVDGSSQTGRILYATGIYETATTTVIKRLLRPGDTMIDVGANIGYFSIAGALAVGARGRVVAFEPVARVRQQLQANLALNGLTNVEIHEEALGAETGRVTMCTGPEDDTGLASLRPLASPGRTAVDQVRFDDLWDEARPVHLIKMDIEGAELAALTGMTQCLSRHAPHLVIEVTDSYLRGLGASAEALATFLFARGYTMYEISHDGLTRIDDPASLRASDQFNALFTIGDR